MVEPILYASLGALLATLLWLLFLPAFWARAARLATKQLIHKLPISKDEIIASQDRLRAEQAMAMRAVERRAEKATAEAVQERIEAARARATELDHLATTSELRERIASLEAEVGRLRTEAEHAGAHAAAVTDALAAATAASETFSDELGAARQDAEAARLSTDQARIEAAARETEIEALRAEISAGETQVRWLEERLVAKESHEAELSRLLKTETSRRAEAEALKAAAERRATAGAAAGEPGWPVDEDGPSRDKELAALRARLDEVADAIVKAAGAEPDAGSAEGGRPTASTERERVRLVPPVPERAGAD